MVFLKSGIFKSFKLDFTLIWVLKTTHSIYFSSNCNHFKPKGITLIFGGSRALILGITFNSSCWHLHVHSICFFFKHLFNGLSLITTRTLSTSSSWFQTNLNLLDHFPSLQKGEFHIVISLHISSHLISYDTSSVSFFNVGSEEI